MITTAVAYTAAGKRYDLRDRIYEVVFIRNMNSISPFINLSLRVEDDLHLSKDFATLKEIELMWSVPKGGEEDSPEEFITGNYVVLEVGTASFGMRSTDQTSPDRHKDNTINIVVKDSLRMKEAFSIYKENVRTESLLRDIIGKSIKYLSPPDLPVLSNIYLPKMTKLDALSTIIHTYGVYKSPVFTQYDIDGFYLFSVGDDQRPTLKLAYHINPTLRDLPRDCIPVSAIVARNATQPLSFSTPTKLDICDYSNSEFVKKDKVTFTGNSTLGNSTHIFTSITDYLGFGSSRNIRQTLEDTLLSGGVSIHCSVDIPIDLRKCVLGRRVELYTDSVMYKAFENEYVVISCNVSLQCKPRGRMRTELILSRFGV